MARILFFLLLLPSLAYSASLHILWTDTSSNEDGFTLQRRAGIQPFEDLVTLPVDTEEFLDTSIFPNVTYTYRVNAFNAAGVSDWSNEASGEWSLATVGAMSQLFLSSVEIPDPPQDPTLVLALDFEEGAGTTTADGSGNGHTGTINGATWTTGKVGNALSFDGVNDWVTIQDANDLDFTTGMTLAAWIYPIALSGGTTNGWRTVILKEAGSTASYDLYANQDTNQPSSYLSIGGVDRGVVGPAQLPLNTWSHLAATYDGAQQRLFINGVQVATRAQTGSALVSAGLLRIGGNSVWGEYFQGRIDDVRIYNRALADGEIRAETGL